MNATEPKRKRGQPGGELHPNFKHGRRSKLIRARRKAELLERLKAARTPDIKINYAGICEALDAERRRRGWS